MWEALQAIWGKLSSKTVQILLSIAVILCVSIFVTVYLSAPPGTKISFWDIISYEKGPYKNLILTKGGNGTGKVISFDGKIDCRESCVYSYPKGKIIRLIPRADRLSDFSGWSDDCKDGKVALNSDKDCTFIFDSNSCVTVDSKTDEWQRFKFPDGVGSVVSINGKWSVNPEKFPSVGPAGYIKGEDVIKLKAAYKNTYLIDNTYPAASLLMRPASGDGISRITSHGNLKENLKEFEMIMNGYKYRFGDNHGFMEVCFGP